MLDRKVPMVDEVNVKDFGAKGDGTDDTEALRSALTYAKSIEGSVRLVLPPGEYLMTSDLTIPSNVAVGCDPNGGCIVVDKDVTLTMCGSYDSLQIMFKDDYVQWLQRRRCFHFNF